MSNVSIYILQIRYPGRTPAPQHVWLWCLFDIEITIADIKLTSDYTDIITSETLKDETLIEITKLVKTGWPDLTQPGFEPPGSRLEPARSGFPELPERETDALLIRPVWSHIIILLHWNTILPASQCNIQLSNLANQSFEPYSSNVGYHER